jgi:small nuclear ribonucleoprotein (snRNP)-like protein
MASEINIHPFGNTAIVTLNKRALAEIRDGREFSGTLVSGDSRLEIYIMRDTVYAEKRRKYAKRKPKNKDIPREENKV